MNAEAESVAEPAAADLQNLEYRLQLEASSVAAVPNPEGQVRAGPSLGPDAPMSGDDDEDDQSTEAGSSSSSSRSSRSSYSELQTPQPEGMALTEESDDEEFDIPLITIFSDGDEESTNKQGRRSPSASPTASRPVSVIQWACVQVPEKAVVKESPLTSCYVDESGNLVTTNATAEPREQVPEEVKGPPEQENPESEPDGAVKEENAVPLPYEIKSYKCGTCSVILGHQRKQKPGGRPQFKCPECDKSFPTLPKLRRHALRHREKTHQCLSCPRKFHTRAEWRNHMLGHSGERPFSCSLCSRAFRTSSSFFLHLRDLHRHLPVQEASAKCCTQCSAKMT